MEAGLTVTQDTFIQESTNDGIFEVTGVWQLTKPPFTTNQEKKSKVARCAFISPTERGAMSQITAGEL